MTVIKEMVVKGVEHLIRFLVTLHVQWVYEKKTATHFLPYSMIYECPISHILNTILYMKHNINCKFELDYNQYF